MGGAPAADLVVKDDRDSMLVEEVSEGAEILVAGSGPSVQCYERRVRGFLKVTHDFVPLRSQELAKGANLKDVPLEPEHSGYMTCARRETKLPWIFHTNQR